MGISEERNNFLSDYPESIPKITSLKKGDYIGQKYEVVAVLGEGGCGTVYLVYYNLHKQFYALKTFKGEYLNSKPVRDRFRKEAQIWIDLDKHPYLVRAYWVEEIYGRLFIGMEFIAPIDKGGPNSLDEYLRKSPPNLNQSLLWAIQFCHGMEYAYSKGIKAHRDIKPANIMIDHTRSVRISDFGLAGIIDSGIINSGEREQMKLSTNQYQTIVGTSMGTPAYMPPEQFIDVSACDERSDIYSFGIVLYQMVSKGQLPFNVENPNHYWAAMKHLHSESQIPTLDSLLFPHIQKCLAKDKGKRYQSFKELRLGLEKILTQLTGEEFIPNCRSL